MSRPPHPGELLSAREIVPRGLSVLAAASALGVCRVHLSRIIHGHAGISAEMSLRIGRVFCLDGGEYLHLQTAFDLDRARRGGEWRARAPLPRKDRRA